MISEHFPTIRGKDTLDLFVEQKKYNIDLNS